MENNVTLQEAARVARSTRGAAKHGIFHEEWSEGQDKERGG